MSDNTFWACFWACITTIVITTSVCAHFSAVDKNAKHVAEYKSAAENGLQQQYIGDKVIGVKK